MQYAQTVGNSGVPQLYSVWSLHFRQSYSQSIYIKIDPDLKLHNIDHENNILEDNINYLLYKQKMHYFLLDFNNVYNVDYNKEPINDLPLSTSYDISNCSFT